MGLSTGGVAIEQVGTRKSNRRRQVLWLQIQRGLKLEYGERIRARPHGSIAITDAQPGHIRPESDRPRELLERSADAAGLQQHAGVLFADLGIFAEAAEELLEARRCQVPIALTNRIARGREDDLALGIVLGARPGQDLCWRRGNLFSRRIGRGRRVRRWKGTLGRWRVDRPRGPTGRVQQRW